MTKLTVEQARNLNGISQEKMALKLGMSKNSYIKKEKGIRRFYIDEAIDFCDIVNVDMKNIIFLRKLCRKNGTTEREV